MQRITGRRWAAGMAAVAAVVACAGQLTSAAGAPRAVLRSFEFPSSFANGLVSDLVPPAATNSSLRFDVAKVAIGELPIPLPERANRRSRARLGRDFVQPIDSGPHARLFLDGVVDASGQPVTSTGSQLIVDALVAPSGASASPPPFTIPFDINAGMAFVDVQLPIQAAVNGAVRVQVLGVTVVDPDGQPFGVLGFAVGPARATPVAAPTRTPGPAAAEGLCFVGPSCVGASFPAGQDKCCRFGGAANAAASAALSWCPPDQVDANTGQCAANACLPCGAPPTPRPGPCGDTAACAGACSVTCADGTTVAGQCTSKGAEGCGCSATCSAPPPCPVGQCFDTIAFQCTGQACGPGLRCALPNQFCDVTGRRCPCTPPPPPQGHVCCECPDAPQTCIDFGFAEAQPICPPGCETFLGQTCDARGERCEPLIPCQSDADCDDGNGCTVDRCTAQGCTHDCVCVGPHACGPGPAVSRPRR